MVYLSGFANIASPEAFVIEIKKRLKTTPQNPHMICVIGPKQEQAQKGINILRKEGIAKRLCAIDTGHGGETKMWIIYNSFRGRPLPE